MNGVLYLRALVFFDHAAIYALKRCIVKHIALKKCDLLAFNFPDSEGSVIEGTEGGLGAGLLVDDVDEVVAHLPCGGDYAVAVGHLIGERLVPGHALWETFCGDGDAVLDVGHVMRTCCSVNLDVRRQKISAGFFSSLPELLFSVKYGIASFRLTVFAFPSDDCIAGKKPVQIIFYSL